MGTKRTSNPKTPGQSTPPAQESPDTVNDGPQLAGSNTLDSVLDIAGRSVPLSKVVEFAHKDSGLSFDDWNELADEERDELLNAKIDQLADAFSLEALPPAATAEDVKVPVVTLDRTTYANMRAADIDPTTLTHPVMTKDGWLCPEAAPKE